LIAVCTHIASTDAKEYTMKNEWNDDHENLGMDDLTVRKLQWMLDVVEKEYLEHVDGVLDEGEEG
jgi:hypothetical protein